MRFKQGVKIKIKKPSLPNPLLGEPKTLNWKRKKNLEKNLPPNSICATVLGLLITRVAITCLGSQHHVCNNYQMTAFLQQQPPK